MEITTRTVTAAARPAASAQVTEIEQFLTVRNLYFGDFDRLWGLLEAYRIDERCPGDGSRISVANARGIMAWLNRNYGATRPATRTGA